MIEFRTRQTLGTTGERVIMAKRDPYSFNFGYNVKPKKKRKKTTKGGGKRSDAWRAYVGAKRR